MVYIYKKTGRIGGTDGGNDTVDKVFLLSLDETLNYFNMTKNENNENNESHAERIFMRLKFEHFSDFTYNSKVDENDALRQN